MADDFRAELLALVRKHDPKAQVVELHGVVTCVTSNVVPLHTSILLEPVFSVLGSVE